MTFSYRVYYHQPPVHPRKLIIYIIHHLWAKRNLRLDLQTTPNPEAGIHSAEIRHQSIVSVRATFTWERRRYADYVPTFRKDTLTAISRMLFFRVTIPAHRIRLEIGLDHHHLGLPTTTRSTRWKADKEEDGVAGYLLNRS